VKVKVNPTLKSKFVSKELQTIPGVGPSIAHDLLDLGYRHVSDLRGVNPERMFERLCEMRGQKIDRCVLYVFRCAAYFADTEAPESELLKWWNWKDLK
jgi:hypothetical protein